MSLEGQLLGEFEVLECLGEGGMGAVYKARQSVLRRLVALKTLKPMLAMDADFVTRFHNEAVAAAALNHPNLVQVYAAGESGGVHWFAMEFVEGESVQNRLQRQGRLDPGEALAICMHVAEGLDYGWRKARLIHRDIKPDNIFLSNDGDVKLGDLGLAKSASQENSLTMTGASMGTPLYISPEQAEARRDIDLRTDIYSLGCTLYHLLSGAPPYVGDSAVSVLIKHCTEPVPDLQALNPGIPSFTARVISRMMQKSPADRHQSYAELSADLQAAYAALSQADEGAHMGGGSSEHPSGGAPAQGAVQSAGGGAARASSPLLLRPVPVVVAGALIIAGGAWLAGGGLRKEGAVPTAARGDAVTSPPVPSQSLPGEWRSLFDGSSLAGWRSLQSEALPPGWSVKDGAIHSTGNRSYLILNGLFKDFELELDWRVEAAGNGGVFYRLPQGADASKLDAPEFQLNDSAQKDAYKAGALWGVIHATKDNSRPVGQWNSARLVVRGKRVEHWVNQEMVCGYDMDSQTWRDLLSQASNRRAVNFANLSSGWIALQGNTGVVDYRNIRLRTFAN